MQERSVSFCSLFLCQFIKRKPCFGKYSQNRVYLQSEASVQLGTCYFYIPPSFWWCCHASYSQSFLSLSLSGHSVWVKQNSQEPTRAALRRLVPCPLLEPWLFCCNDLKPTISERLIKNDYELERRRRHQHQMAEIFLFPHKSSRSFKNDFFQVKGWFTYESIGYCAGKRTGSL